MLPDGGDASPTQESSSQRHAPLLIVLSGPSGVGKDAILSRMRAAGLPYHFTVTATTRPKRPGERNGVDYIFLSKDEFNLMILRDEFLEHAEVYGNQYGVPKQQVREAMAAGKDVIIKTDVQGAKNIRKLAPGALGIFVAPGQEGELERRLHARLTESPDTLALRLKTAATEMEEAKKFDHVVYNSDGRLDNAVIDIKRLVEAERGRLPYRCVTL